jgi:hypothetical protein
MSLIQTTKKEKKKKTHTHNVSLKVVDYKNYFKIAIVKWKKNYSCDGIWP